MLGFKNSINQFKKKLLFDNQKEKIYQLIKQNKTLNW